MHDPYESLVPIFRTDENRTKLSQHGTGVLLKLNGKQYLLSAAHVFHNSKPGDLYSPTKDGMAPLHGILRILTSSDVVEEDFLDLAVLGLNGAFKSQLKAHFKPFPQTRCRLVESALELGCCSISGYPISKAENRPSKLSSEIYSYRGVAATEQIYDKFGIDPSINIIVHYDKSRAVHPGTLTPAPSPSFRGVSGGAFAWPDNASLSTDWTLPSLVGIFHTYREKDGIAIGTLLMPIIGITQVMEMQRRVRIEG